jgi:hypothetical protein
MNNKKEKSNPKYKMLKIIFTIFAFIYFIFQTDWHGVF